MKPGAKFCDALTFATQLHANQMRKGKSVPYIAHLLAVTSIALEHGATEDEAIAALLHDAVEDQGGLPTLEKIRARFGDAVARIVLGCTDSTVTDPAKKPPWKERKVAYLAHLEQAAPSVRLISAADKFHNARSLLADYRLEGEGVWERFNGGKDGTLWYYSELLKRFKEAGPGPLADELERVLTELKALAQERSK